MMGETPSGLRGLSEDDKGLGDLNHLPVEMRLHIYEFLSVRDHLGLQLASKALRSEADLPRTVVSHLLHTVRMIEEDEKNGNTGQVWDQKKKVVRLTRMAEQKLETHLHRIPQWGVLKIEVDRYAEEVDPRVAVKAMQGKADRLTEMASQFRFNPPPRSRCIMQ